LGGAGFTCTLKEVFMRIPALPFVLVSLIAAPALALTVDSVSETELRRYSATLAEQASNTQWQQLWRNTRQNGRFDDTGAGPRFTLPMREIPGLVRQTLAAPDLLQISLPTSTRLRRDFGPRTTGQARGVELTAICVLVDWRGAPDPTFQAPLQPHDLFYVSLTNTEPC
jgi:hypothetical protein